MSPVMLKGRIGFDSVGWPLIVIERARSDKPNTPVLCEVFGLEHESGSIYYEEIALTKDRAGWEESIKKMGHDPSRRYFKGELI